VIDHLTSRGYDVYALDLRGMGLSKGPSGQPDYAKIDMFNRVNDVVAVASHIIKTTGQAPVVIGWSGGGVVTGLFAATHPELLTGIGLLSVARDGFVVPPDLMPILGSLLGPASPASFQPTEPVVNEIIFGIDPVTRQSTMSLDAENTFFSLTEPDSVKAVLQETELCPFPFLPGIFTGTCARPAWASITAPALVVDGALDPLVGENRAQALFHALGSNQ
jgi:pimeloyl-ACP methyl ester carboxylesterase